MAARRGNELEGNNKEEKKEKKKTEVKRDRWKEGEGENKIRTQEKGWLEARERETRSRMRSASPLSSGKPQRPLLLTRLRSPSPPSLLPSFDFLLVFLLVVVDVRFVKQLHYH